MTMKALRTAMLAGGGGGAKLAAGMNRTQSVADGLVVTNVGDDFEHTGLLICPDTDSVLYALAGCIDPKKGWGRANESWRVHETLGELGAPQWFQLGDQDIALHLRRLALLKEGLSLTEVTQYLATAMNIEGVTVCPASDQTVRTQLDTNAGRLDFQTYFVAQRCSPHVNAIKFAIDTNAKPSAAIADFVNSGIDCLIIAPSNPILSIAPILAVPGMGDLLQQSRCTVAMSPIVDGMALKGPLAKLMEEFALEVSAVGWCRYMQDIYPGSIDYWVFDKRDRCREVELRALVPKPLFLDSIITGPAHAGALIDQVIAEVVSYV